MIGIFDSGLGGLTVVRELMAQLPDRQLVYFGDTARYPYGQRSPEVIRRYAKQDVDFLLSKGTTIIIAACNTASAVAYDFLRESFDVPIFEVITPAVEEAARVSKSKRIGVIGTRATIGSGIYEKLLKENGDGFTVFTKACPLFVPIVEENWTKRPEAKTIAKKYLQGMKTKSIDTLILGCTHYPMMCDIIQSKIGRRVHIVDPAHETAKAVKQYIASHPDIEKELPKSGDHQFYLSDVTDHAQEVAKRWLGRDVRFQSSGLLDE